MANQKTKRSVRGLLAAMALSACTDENMDAKLCEDVRSQTIYRWNDGRRFPDLPHWEGPLTERVCVIHEQRIEKEAPDER